MSRSRREYFASSRLHPSPLHPVENSVGDRQFAQEGQRLLITIGIDECHPIGIESKTSPLIREHIEDDEITYFAHEFLSSPL